MTIYSDYLKRKSQNAIKFGYSDEYPCVLKNSKGKELKDYQIYGNSKQQNKNLLQYPYRDTTKTQNGITYTDNKDGSISINGTATNNTTFSLMGEVEINNKLNANKSYVLSGCPENGSKDTYGIMWDKVGYDVGLGYKKVANLKMGSLIIYIKSGTTCDNLTFKPQIEEGTVKTDYISQVPMFENPIEIEYMGEKTTNLFNYTDSKNDNQIKADVDGWFDVTIDNSSGTDAIYKNCWTNVNSNLKIDTKYYLYTEIAETSGDIIYVPCSVNVNNNSQFKYGLSTASGYITTVSNFTDSLCMLRTYCACKAGTSGHIKFRISVYEEKQDWFEPYDKYKIPLICRGKNVFDISKCVSYRNTDNSIYISPNAQRGVMQGNVKDITQMKAGRTYIISANSTSNTGHFVYLSGSKKVWYWDQIYTPTQEDIDGKIAFYKATSDENDEGLTTGAIITNVQIEEATIKSEYESYKMPIITNIYLDKPLKGLPDKCDIIDFKNQKLIQNIDEVILNGTEYWKYMTGSNNGINYDTVGTVLSKFMIGNKSNALLSTGLFKAGFYNQQTYIGFTSWSTPAGTLMYKKDGITVDIIKELLQNQNVTIVAILKDPIETSIDLSKLPTLKGTTIYEIDSNVIPQSMKIKYIRN